MKAQVKARKKGKGKVLKPGEGLADMYWSIFKDACAHKKQPVRAVALDCIEKLIGTTVVVFVIFSCLC